MREEALIEDALVGSQKRIWLIGGTSDSAKLAIALSNRNLPYVATVTTEAARQLYPPSATVQVGKMTPDRIGAWIREQNIVCILDASHPFACEISRQAIAAAALTYEHAGSIAYLRYERADVTSDDVRSSTDSCVIEQTGDMADGTVITVNTIEDLICSDLLQHQRVLFTLGCRELFRFAPLRQTSQLFARILPSADAIAQAKAAGFAPHEMMAIRPPVSAALEKALWQQWRITRVVAKASGGPSGEAIKRQVAADLGVGLVLLKRPTVSYPQQTSNLSEAIEVCSDILSDYSR